MTTKPASAYTLSEIKALKPLDHPWSQPITCDTLILLPGTAKQIHDSGYRLIAVIPCVKGIPLGKLDFTSDVIHLDGLGGYGLNWLNQYEGVPDLVPPTAWSIDCLPKSGLFSLFLSNHSVLIGQRLSSLEIYAVPRSPEQKPSSPIYTDKK